MTDMNSYPLAAEAVDTQLSKSIDTLTSTTRDGFNRVESQMRDMATKDAVGAHVARLDLRVDHVNEKVDSGFESVKSDMASGFASVALRDAERDVAAEKRELAREQIAKDRDDKRDKKFTQRMTWTLGIVAILWGIAEFLLAPLIGS